jgi:hypothetical protein
MCIVLNNFKFNKKTTHRKTRWLVEKTNYEKTFLIFSKYLSIGIS